MKISRLDIALFFDKLAIGDVFIIDDAPYMKISELHISLIDGTLSDCYANAIRLDNGALEYFDALDKVLPRPEAILTIK